MLKSRFVLIVLAVFLSISATAVAGIYLKNLEKEIKVGGELTSVYVAQRSVKPGTTFEEMLLKKLVISKEIPRKYVASGATYFPEKMDNKVLAVSLTKGDQLTVDKFKLPPHLGLSLQIPENMVAISILVDEVIGVSNLILSGDHVMVIATFESSKKGPELSRILLPDVQVLTTSQNVTSQNKNLTGSNSVGAAQTGLNKKTITVAVSPADAEKVAFAQEKGRLFLALIPAKGLPGGVNTPGITWETVF